MLALLPGGMSINVSDETTSEILRMIEQRAPYLFEDAAPFKQGRKTLRALARDVLAQAMSEYAARHGHIEAAMNEITHKAGKGESICITLNSPRHSHSSRVA